MPVEHKRRPRLPKDRPFAYFQWNYGWGIWEQVMPEFAGKRGVVAAYAHPPADTSAGVSLLGDTRVKQRTNPEPPNPPINHHPTEGA